MSAPASEWRTADIEPAPGQRVLLYYQDASGEIRGPIISTPIHADGSHLCNGRSIYAPIVRWMPLPEWEGAR